MKKIKSLVPSFILSIFGLVNLVLAGVLLFLFISKDVDVIWAFPFATFFLVWSFTIFAVAHITSSTETSAKIIYLSYIPSVFLPLSLLGLWQLSNFKFKKAQKEDRQIFKIFFVSVMGVLNIPFNFLVLFFILFFISLFDFPSPTQIGKEYMKAIVVGDMNKITSLTHGNYGCVKAMKGLAEHDMAFLKGAEVRNVIYEIVGPGGSREELVGVWMNFEYKKPGDVDWRKGTTSILTDKTAAFTRSACGNDGFSYQLK